ncbi:MAG TPA: hypothetical protein VMB34_13600 [Acetobacteraceae bacterium]|nr:hypothetical protein [Acetobacteraceae bacterium]
MAPQPPSKPALGLVALICRYLLVAAALFLVQVPAIPGFFIMLLGGPVWASIVVNLMMLHVGLSAFAPGRSRYRLLVPAAAYLAWFIGIAVVNWTTVQRVRSYDAENRLSEQVPPDADLVFDHGYDRLIPYVMRLSPDRGIFVGPHRLVIDKVARTRFGSDCTAGGKRLPWGEWSFGPRNSDMAAVLDCINTRLDLGPHPGIRISRIEPGDWSNVAYSIGIEDASGTTRPIGYFRSGRTTILTYWPLFWAGCVLDDANSAWRCSVRLFSQRFLYYGADRPPPWPAGIDPVSQFRAKALVTLVDTGQVR